MQPGDMTPEELARQVVASTLHHNLISQTRDIHFKAAVEALAPLGRVEFDAHLEAYAGKALNALNNPQEKEARA